MLFLVYWVFIYYRKYLKYKSSIFTGIISSIIIIYLYYIQFNRADTYISTKDYWAYCSAPLADVRTDLSSIKTNNPINIKNEAYAVSMEYFNKLKNKQEVSSMDTYSINDNNNKKTHTKTQPNTDTETQPNTETQTKTNTEIKNYLLSFLVYKANNLGFQGLCLITILFTILSLTWNTNKQLFKKIFSLFIHALTISIPFTFLWYWFYSTDIWIKVSNIKMLFLFGGISITLAIIVEIFNFY